MDTKIKTAFIDSWGEMGTVWGLNSSMARVHALLLVSEGPLSLDHIAKELKISRGNASMSLKELRAWGVIKRVKVAGDRRDYYLTEPDIWRMFFAIGRERKRREFDPMLNAVREAMEAAQGGKDAQVSLRLKEMDQMLSTLDKLIEQVLVNESQGRALIALLAGVGGGQGKR